MEYLLGIAYIQISEFGVKVWIEIQSLYITCLFLPKKEKRKRLKIVDENFLDEFFLDILDEI